MIKLQFLILPCGYMKGYLKVFNQDTLIIPDGCAYVKSTAEGIQSYASCHSDRMGVTLFDFLIVPKYVQKITLDKRSES